ncbi:hypothetical protein MVEN_02196600 [Mycena venus]|uniref:Uncharacterized protein n=1 Tax=Mycena venus TaxID=2733690 RepID=A0A8H6X7F7_9AGAR|nr:hypothetical protein MVEN_02196600 [Mycena venus]
MAASTWSATDGDTDRYLHIVVGGEGVVHSVSTGTGPAARGGTARRRIGRADLSTRLLRRLLPPARRAHGKTFTGMDWLDGVGGRMGR